MSGFASGNLATVQAGRSCGQCSLCCKLLRIDSLSKPQGTWCPHCKPGKGGCTIYSGRPLECQNFLCFWLTSPDFAQIWHPLTSKMVVYMEGEGNRIAIHVDPSFPLKWREEPYFSRIKEWALFAADNSAQVVIYLKNRVTVVFPNKEVDLGEFDPEDHIMSGELNVPFGRDWDAYIRRAKDIPEDERDKWVIT
jgi:hypothetical protein